MIILDASTVILLGKINLLETFVSAFPERVLISGKVRDEISIKGTEENPLIVKLIKDKKMQVLKVKNGKLIKKLMDDFNIEIGEAETIVLALQEKASIVATDDRNATRACKILKIDFTTAIAILIRAFEKHWIDKDEALIKLRKLDSVARYRREIVEDARGRIEGGDGHVNKNT
jgi:predicted nucleic acid-binding protein